MYHSTDEKPKGWLFVCLMVFIATFNNISVISWRSVLLLEETGGPGEKYQQEWLSFNRCHIRYHFEDCVIIFKKHRSIMRNIMSCCYAQEYTYISLKFSFPRFSTFATYGQVSKLQKPCPWMSLFILSPMVSYTFLIYRDRVRRKGLWSLIRLKSLKAAMGSQADWL